MQNLKEQPILIEAMKRFVIISLTVLMSLFMTGCGAAINDFLEGNRRDDAGQDESPSVPVLEQAVAELRLSAGAEVQSGSSVKADIRIGPTRTLTQGTSISMEASVSVQTISQ